MNDFKIELSNDLKAILKRAELAYYTYDLNESQMMEILWRHLQDLYDKYKYD